MGADGQRFLDGADPLYPPLDTAGVFAAVMQRRGTSPAPGARSSPTARSCSRPIWTQPPFPAGWDLDNAEATMRLMRPVMPANLLGLPAAAVPAGKAGGLPCGVQVMADRYQDLATLDAAAAIEQALGVATPIDPVLEEVTA